MSTQETSTDLDEALTERQIQALEKLHALGKAPRESPDDKYDQDPKVRALQLVFEGRFGGPNRGQGRKRHPRAAEIVAEEVRTKLAPKIVKALRNGLDSENEKIALSAAETAIKIERDETALQIKERSADEDLSKEELIEALFELASDASTTAAVESFVEVPEDDIEEITEAEVVSAESTGRQEARRTQDQAEDDYPEAPTRRRRRASSTAEEAGSVEGSSGRNGARAAKGNSQKRSGNRAKTSRRRPADG